MIKYGKKLINKLLQNEMICYFIYLYAYIVFLNIFTFQAKFLREYVSQFYVEYFTGKEFVLKTIVNQH